MHIPTQLSQIQSEIAASAEKAGRLSSEVQLIAVSKTYPIDAVIETYQAGQRNFGENRPQEMKEKHAMLVTNPAFSEIKWHLIGQLQKNKVKLIAPFVYMIHSVDDLELIEEIQKQALKYQRTIYILLQINISNETQKSGISAIEAEDILYQMPQFTHVKVAGFMGMAALTNDSELIKSQFHQLTEIRNNLQKKYPKMALTELSMGMSGDYEIAIEEGATMVRIGTAIFGKR